MINSKKLHIRFLQYNESLHLYQIYAGFGLLENMGVLTSSFENYSNYKFDPYGKKLIGLTINDEVKIAYDTEDYANIDLALLDWCDFYFKRSFSEDIHWSQSTKINPLGLYYFVYADEMGFYGRLKSNCKNINITSKNFIKSIFRNSPLFSRLFRIQSGYFVNEYQQFEMKSIANKDPKIIFMAKVWDPSHVHNPEHFDERLRINKVRCDCVKKLREEFSHQFIGGIFPSEYALENYKDFVAQDKSKFHKYRYLSLMHKADIGVATTGLLKSNGAKLAEYIAESKAIVSEKLHFSVPGGFQAGKNFLEFDSADKCVEQVHRLVNDLDFRFSMMKRNQDYYQNYLRPDKLIWNTLEIAMNAK